MQKRVIMKTIRTPGSDFIARHRASLLTIYIFVSHQASLVCPEYVRGVVTGPLASRSVLPRPPYFLSGELRPLGELGVGFSRRPVGAPRWACGALLCGAECAPHRCAAVGGAHPWGGCVGVSLWGGGGARCWSSWPAPWRASRRACSDPVLANCVGDDGGNSGGRAPRSPVHG